MSTRILSLAALVLALIAAACPVRAQEDPTYPVITPENAAQIVEVARFGRGGIFEIAISPRGDLVAVATDIGIWLYDMHTGDTVHFLEGHTSAVTTLAWSPDGSLLASGSYDNTVRVWNVVTGTTITVFEAHTNDVKTVAFAPDGTTVASLDWRTYTVHVWNAHTGERLLTFEDITAFGLAFAPDGTTLRAYHRYYGSPGLIMDLVTGATREDPRATFLHTNGFAHAPDWQTVLAVYCTEPQPDRRCTRSEIRLHDALTGDLLHTFHGHTNFVTGLAYAPDGRTFISASSDRTVRRWDIATGAQLQLYESPMGGTGAIAFAPDGEAFLSIMPGNILRLWDVETGNRIWTVGDHFSDVGDLVVAPDGQTVVLKPKYSPRVWLHNLTTGRLIRFYYDDNCWCNRIAMTSSAPYRIAASCSEGRVVVWDYRTGDIVQTYEQHIDYAMAVAFAPDDQTIVSGDSWGELHLWDIQTGATLQEFKGHSTVEYVAFAPGGLTLVSGGGIPDDSIRVWNVLTGSQMRVYEREWGVTLRDVAISPDGQLILSGAEAKTHAIRLRDMWTGETLPLFEDVTHSVHSVAFSPDGRLIISTDNAIRVWDAHTGELLTVLDEHIGSVPTATFTPDGTQIVSGGEDGTIRVWGVPVE